MTEKGLPPSYNPETVETKWYRFWEEKGFFHAEVERDKEPFCIVMPPPNVTGALHMGHAMDNTLQDILIRWRRMQGYNTLWVPGTDHAGIATQAKVEEKLAEEGLSKYDLGREKFLERVWEWKEHYHARIASQLRRLGSSCDWQRERFTMDPGCSKAVQEVFVELYRRGLIYRGDYIINWCPKCSTTISDIEVEHEEKEGHFYYLKYPLADGDGYVVVATTRPETMLGDTAVAVHPEDERYHHLVGKKVILPLVNREIPVIADEYVDREFGTGVVKITPAHDPNDFEVGLRHNLPVINVMNKDATMNEEAGPYQGLDRYECRRKIVEDLKAGGYLLKVEDHTHAVGHCYRCGTVVEPMVSKQWFVRMKPLAEPAIQAVKEGRIRFVPERFTRIYLNWVENIRDWCISRQLWWGHRIPVWYCQNCGETICEKEEPQKCSACGSTQLEQDPDVLDTWFSSALWPFETLGWPDRTPELEHFYPTSVLVTGRDIIFFWVARMIFMGLEFMKDVPFREVFIHGLVLDAEGRKMSKSLGNGVDPIEVIEKYGADTLRMTLVTGNTPGNDLRFRLERLEGARNFCNKLWNASRFVLMNLGDFQPGEDIIDGNKFRRENLTVPDRWILSRYNATVEEVTRAMERYDLGEAVRLLYEFVWNEYCDWYIEAVKPRLNSQEEESRRLALEVLWFVLQGTLRLLHPFLPFITEEIWQHLPHRGETIMLQPWPKPDPALTDAAAEEQMQLLMEVIKSVRNLRSEVGIPVGRKVEAVVRTAEGELKDVLSEGRKLVEHLAWLSELTVEDSGGPEIEQALAAAVKGVEVYLPLKGVIDLEKERERLEKEIKRLDKELARVQGKLNNESFLKKAPPEVVAKEREKEKIYLAEREALLERKRRLFGAN
ncbi:MAG: valyl-tRNA synthetase [Eubacteriales bacterium]|nr:valyl-tRNA synthetase [Eubacteriales bacterium]